MSKKAAKPDAERAALARIHERLREAGSINQTGDDWTCPCHDDKGASLTVRVGDVPGRVVMTCGAGCSRKSILKKLGLKESDLFTESVASKETRRKKYVYKDEGGKPLFRVTRVETVGADGHRTKVFYQAGAKPGGGWRQVEKKSGHVVRRPMEGVRLVLWRLPMLARAIKDGVEIHLAEGEKDVEALAQAGVPATCHPMGAGKWQDEYCQSLAGAPSVVVWADRDAAGYRCAAQRLSSLLAAGLPAMARLPVPDHLGADVADHLAAGHSPADGKPVTLEELELLATGSALGSWAPEDLTEILRGTFKPLLPTVGRRDEDGLALFYPGKRHLLIAESEAGKTWLALYAAKQEMEDGHHVFFYDFEDDASGVVGRLLDMDCARTAIEQFFHYVRPDEPVTEELLEAVIARHRALRPTLVITDGVTEVMSQNGWGQSENNDIADFYNTILKPMASEGAAVVALDHLPKYDEKGRGAIGGVHKLNGIDGAAYRLEADREIAPGRVGRTRVKHDKDRPGQVKRHAESKKRIADLIVDAEGEGPVLVMLFPPDAYRLDGESVDSEPVAKKATDSEARVLACFQDDEWRPTSAVYRQAKNDFGDKAPSATTVKRNLCALVDGGVLERRQERDANNRKIDMWRQP